MKTLIQRQVVRAVRALAPGVSFGVTQEGEVIRWPVNAGDPPTQSEINTKIAEQQAQDATKAAQQVEDDIDRVIVAGNADIRALLQLRPSQIEDRINANVNNLDEAKAVMIRTVKVVSILAKQMFR